MTTRHLFFIVLVTFIFSCKKAEKFPFDKNKNEFCEMLAEMHENDQKYRLMTRNPFFEILDSIKKAEGIHEIYSTLPREKQLSYGKIAQEITDKKHKKFTKKEKDSLMRLQTIIDNANTEKLIEITQEFGWVTKNNIGCTQNFVTSLIFRHSQSQYHDKIKVVILKARNEGKMNEGDYTLILNHLNGRENFEITNEKIKFQIK